MTITAKTQPRLRSNRSAARTLVQAVLASRCGLAIAGASAQEVEPNDTLATAMGKGLIGIGSETILGAAIGNGQWGEQDVDLYFIVIDATTPIPVALTVDVQALDPALDGLLRLFDDSGRELANQDDRAFDDPDPWLRTYLVSAGVYFVGVSAAENPVYDNTEANSGRPGGTGVYTLTITTEAAGFPAESLEPNDELATATPMGDDSFSVTGEFIGDGAFGRRDLDIYQLSLSGPARVDIDVVADAIGSPLDAVAQIVQSDRVLAVRDDLPDGSLDPHLSVGVPSARDVYIVVSGAGNPKLRSAYRDAGEPGSVGEYELDVIVTYFESGGPLEPNDSIIAATPSFRFPLPPGSENVQRMEAFLGDGPFSQTRGDRDFYTLAASGSGVFTIDVEATSDDGFDPVLTLYETDGNRLAVNDNGGDGANSRIAMPLGCRDLGADEEQRVAYVMVTGAGQRSPDDPFVPWPMADDLTADRYEEFTVGDGPGSTGAYTLTFHWDPNGDDCGIEPNDTLATATDTGIVDQGVYFCTTNWIGDGICDDPALDVDLWKVTVANAPTFLSVLVFDCETDPTPFSDNRIRVFDVSGMELTTIASYEIQRAQPTSIEYAIANAGTYYVGVGDAGNEWFDPTIACSGSPDFVGQYGVIIQLTQRGSRSVTTDFGPIESAAVAGDVDPSAALFATRLDDVGGTIDAIDPDTGVAFDSFDAPEPLFSGAEGLAYDGSGLYYVGVGWYPKLYRLDPDSGDVLDETILWFGSGWYGDATMLGGLLYVLDHYDRSVHVMDPLAGRYLGSLSVGAMSHVSMGGGIAGLSGPNRLYVADAFNTGGVYEVHPTRGAVTAVLPATDVAPTALASTAEGTLIYGNWLAPSAVEVDRAGAVLGKKELDYPVGSLAGDAGVVLLGDFNRDGAVDLLDAATFQRCFSGVTELAVVGCEGVDITGDDRLDVYDIADYASAITGP